MEWRGKPVWILKRTPEQIASLAKTEPQLADPKSDRKTYPTLSTQNQHRSIKPEIFVGVGICTHLGCSPGDKFQTGPQPSLPDDWNGGFLCACHGSLSTWLAACSRTSLRLTTWKSRPTCICPIRVC